MLRLRLHNFQGSHYSHDIGGGQAGAENQRAGIVLDIVHHIRVSGNKAADGGEGFTEGSHNQIHIVRQSKVGGRSPAVAQHP